MIACHEVGSPHQCMRCLAHVVCHKHPISPSKMGAGPLRLSHLRRHALQCVSSYLVVPARQRFKPAVSSIVRYSLAAVAFPLPHEISKHTHTASKTRGKPPKEYSTANTDSKTRDTARQPLLPLLHTHSPPGEGNLRLAGRGLAGSLPRLPKTLTRVSDPN